MEFDPVVPTTHIKLRGRSLTVEQSGLPPDLCGFDSRRPLFNKRGHLAAPIIWVGAGCLSSKANLTLCLTGQGV